jgi:hypothetical protein
MYGNAQGSVPARVTIGMIVLYALVLQAYIAAAAPALGFDAVGDIRCAPSDARQEAPGGKHTDPHCLCCVLACAACAFATAAGRPTFSPRDGSIITFALKEAAAARASSQTYFEARGPPSDL